MKIVYLTVEAPREGQASFVHVHEIIAGLRAQGAVVRLYQPSYTQKFVSPALPWRLLHALWLQIRLWMDWQRGSILYIRAHYLALPSALIARVMGIPVVHEINGPYEDVFVTYPALNQFRRLLIPMQRWQYRMATRLIAVTQELVEWANREGQRNDCCFISNGANTALFHPDVPRPGDAPDQYVVFFGGLTRWHGVPVMLEAAAQPQWPAAVKLLIIGDGQETPAVLKAAAADNKIIFAGRKNYTDIPGYVAHAMAGIVMISDPDKRSSTGVFPLKLFETLACGIPAIVSDLPGQGDFIRTTDSGYVLAADDAGALAQTVAHITAQPAEASHKGSNGRATVVREHSWQTKASETFALLSLLDGK